MQVLSWLSYLMKNFGALRAHSSRFSLQLMTIIKVITHATILITTLFRKTEVHPQHL
ncbi:hypothetical protein HOLleu_17643 [Holothuria leucospilota]|uniref:Uncharacterized protein n=1 Tax=Holothuria leucospilota TaxID=206669 RepID=A0A9Q1C0N8_HOLLE|nr:hypothetical protein HOLleu_17643 [Holothuria leucospilota]